MNELSRLNRLEHKVKLLTTGWLLSILILAVVGWTAAPQQQDTLRLRQIIIVDDNGTERVWIGAPVPDPIVQGERVPRSGPISGIVLLDTNGNERSGYVTSDLSGAVFLSLDSEEDQEALFLANPGGGVHLSIYNTEDDLAQIGVLDGEPRVVLRNDGTTVFEQR